MIVFGDGDQEKLAAKIKVIGVGGGGCNAVNSMIGCESEGVDYIAANTDSQVLSLSRAPVRLQLGDQITKGLGAGADPQIGRKAALEDRDRIREVLEGADMVFVTAGMGGGTGTGGAPVVSEVARELGTLTVAVVTRPFGFEGPRRARQAEEGLIALRKNCDTLIVISNQKLLNVVPRKTPLTQAFKIADDVLRQAVQGIAGLVLVPGLVNVDFADVRTVMSHTGRAVMGMGVARGDKRAVEAAEQAIASPLLEDMTVQGAKGVLVNITGGEDLSLFEVEEASQIIREAAHPDANIIFGSVVLEKALEEVKVTVIATGFEELELSELGQESGAHTPGVRGKMSRLLETPSLFKKVGSLEVKSNNGFSSEEEWEVPTFMRRKQ